MYYAIDQIGVKTVLKGEIVVLLLTLSDWKIQFLGSNMHKFCYKFEIKVKPNTNRTKAKLCTQQIECDKKWAKK